MQDKKIKVRARLVIIKEGKLLATYNSVDDFYFYAGGRLEYGETLAECCAREVREECGEDVEFKFKKILYVRDFIAPEQNEHSVEFFILGEINKFAELEHRLDPEYGNKTWLTWLDLANLPANLKPVSLTEKMLSDYKLGFPNQGDYTGEIS